MTWTINADSIPVLDSWGWADYWEAKDWIAWHRLNVQAVGLEKANEKFVHWYHQAEPLSASYSWRTFDGEFRDYAKQNGFFDALFSGILGGIVRPLGAVGDAAQATVKTFESFSGGLPVFVSVVLIVIILAVVYRAYRFATA